MPAPILLTALLLLQDPTGAKPPQTPAPQAPSAPAFQTPMTIAEPVRLALTPKLDGAIQEEEWDPIVSTENLKGYFQWEPGKLHVAGMVPTGQDLLVSVDLRSDGWLVSGDNLEFRIGMRDGTPRIFARRLDAAQVNGPHWIDLPGIAMASTVVAKTDGGNTTYEVSLGDAGLGYFPMDDGGRMSVRMDSIASDAPPVEPFVPRVLTPVTLSLTRAAGLPLALHWKVEHAGETVQPGDTIRLRFAFNGDNKLGLQRFAVRSEGLSRAATAETSVPFPPFDNKGRSFVDYLTLVANGPDLGYRVARGTLTGADGIPGVIQASYWVAPLMEVRLVREPIRSKPSAQRVRLTYYIKSYSPDRHVSGTLKLTPSEGLHLANGDQSGFFIDAAKGGLRRVFEVDVPAGAKGVYPIGFRVETGGKVLESTGYVNID